MVTLEVVNWALDALLVGMASFYFSRKLKENSKKRRDHK